MGVFEDRQKKIFAAFKSQGTEKAVIGEPLHIFYLTGRHIVPYERFYGLVLDVEKETMIMVNPSVDTGCMKGTIPEITYRDEDGPTEALQKALCGETEDGAGTPGQRLKGGRQKQKRVAVEKSYYPMKTGELFGELAEEINDTGSAVSKVRMYKDETEIRTMKRAAEIVDEALSYVSGKICPGMTEKELKMMLYQHMSETPGFIADEFIILVLAAENSANPHGTSGDYAFRQGDIILLDFCAYYEYYWSDITRCFFVGECADERLAEIYEIVKKANETARKAVRPGVRAKEIDQAARKVIEDAGFGAYFLHRTGHGLGLSVHEEPYITSENELVLEPGMTFTIEPGIYLEGIGGVRIEDDILVTEYGCETLTKSPREKERWIARNYQTK